MFGERIELPDVYKRQIKTKRGLIKPRGENQIQHEYVKHYTNASFLVDEGFKFEDGLFVGFDEEKRT